MKLNLSRTRLTVLLLALLCLLTGAACDRATKVTLSGGDHPTFDLSGSGTLKRLQVEGPAGPEWAIVAEGLGDSVGRFEGITYGEVPPGYTQTVPGRGTAPPLVEGKTYYLTVDTKNEPALRVPFIISDGKAIAQPVTKNGSSTGP
jgi:hypothetical protein